MNQKKCVACGGAVPDNPWSVNEVEPFCTRVCLNTWVGGGGYEQWLTDRLREIEDVLLEFGYHEKYTGLGVLPAEVRVACLRAKQLVEAADA